MSTTPSWTEALKAKLTKLAASESVFELYPGTPAYIARAALVEAIAANWRDALFDYVLNDIKDGVSGRRKHYWHTMECLIAYELLPDALAEQESLSSLAKLSGFDREIFLERTTQYATWIPCPQFLSPGRISPSPEPRSPTPMSPPTSPSPRSRRLPSPVRIIVQPPSATLKPTPVYTPTISPTTPSAAPSVTPTAITRHAGIIDHLRAALSIFGTRMSKSPGISVMVASAVGLLAFGLVPRLALGARGAWPLFGRKL